MEDVLGGSGKSCVWPALVLLSVPALSHGLFLACSLVIAGRVVLQAWSDPKVWKAAQSPPQAFLEVLWKYTGQKQNRDSAAGWWPRLVGRLWGPGEAVTRWWGSDGREWWLRCA